MLAAERHRRMTEALRVSRIVSTEEFSRLLGVSPETVRRDLVALERTGVLVRVHGGATIDTDTVGEEAPFAERSAERHETKSRIGKLAAEQVFPGQTLIFDVGTTVLEVARALPNSFRGTVATCSLLVAAELAGRTGVEVLVSGGRVRGGDLACSNHQALEFFSNIRADVAFLGSGGLDADAGLTDFHIDEAATRKTILAGTAKSYVLADATKFGRVAPHRICGFDRVEAVITDQCPPDRIHDAIESAGASALF